MFFRACHALTNKRNKIVSHFEVDLNLGHHFKSMIIYNSTLYSKNVNLEGSRPRTPLQHLAQVNKRTETDVVYERYRL